MEGMLNVKEQKIKLKDLFFDETKPIKDYLLNFSNAASVFSVDAMKKRESVSLQFMQNLKGNL